MHQATVKPEEIISAALAALRQRTAPLDFLDDLPAAVYTTDGAGRITYFNRACIALAGRTPVAGQDQWCVTWKLYGEDGAFMPHDRCPMAVAIAEKRPVRGVEAVAERPDGSRISFRPFPTPLLDEQGEVVGAVNLLLATTDRRQAEYLRTQAQRCRRLARSVDDRAAAVTLLRLADDYEEKADRLDRLH
jgi:PAS domain S-box-containing protein